MKVQKPLLGASLALLATMTWGSLPLAVQQVLQVLDASTLVWSRFVVAALFLGVLGLIRGTLPRFSDFNKRHYLLLLMASVALTANFVLYSEGLHYISPTTTQVLWQLAPFGMMVSGVILFGERLGVFQKTGSVLLIVGLLAFFNQNFEQILQLGDYAKGIFITSAASLIWVAYGIAQKLLLPHLSSRQILLMVYIASALLLTPMSNIEPMGDLQGFILICFVFCCANTLIGYGAYGEALNYWDASKISVITTMLPIFTMLFSVLAHNIAPHTFAALEMNVLSYVGAFVAVLGAILAVAGDALFYKSKAA